MHGSLLGSSQSEIPVVVEQGVKHELSLPGNASIIVQTAQWLSRLRDVSIGPGLLVPYSRWGLGEDCASETTGLFLARTRVDSQLCWHFASHTWLEWPMETRITNSSESKQSETKRPYASKFGSCESLKGGMQLTNSEAKRIDSGAAAVGAPDCLH